MDKIINLAHKEVGIVPSKHHPVTNKDLVIKQNDSKIQYKANEQSY